MFPYLFKVIPAIHFFLIKKFLLNIMTNEMYQSPPSYSGMLTSKEGNKFLVGNPQLFYFLRLLGNRVMIKNQNS